MGGSRQVGGDHTPLLGPGASYFLLVAVLLLLLLLLLLLCDCSGALLEFTVGKYHTINNKFVERKPVLLLCWRRKQPQFTEDNHAAVF